MIPDSNILNNKRSIPSFSVQILSISHFPEYNLCWTKEKDRGLSSIDKQKEYVWTKKSKKVFCRFYRFLCKNALFTGAVFCMCYIQQSTEHLPEGIQIFLIASDKWYLFCNAHIL